MSSLRTPSPDAVFLFAGFPQAAETMDRVSRPEAREVEGFLYPTVEQQLRGARVPEVFEEDAPRVATPDRKRSTGWRTTGRPDAATLRKMAALRDYGLTFEDLSERYGHPTSSIKSWLSPRRNARA